MRWINGTIANQERSPRGFGGEGVVRSYVESRSARDARTGVEKDLDATLGGELDDFMLAALSKRLW
ncbi:hypothetical protein [Bradyrhizobium sp. Tv2a-2]|uniref:hypothetical protein n=1 Tax=Bradyrhizobium sp. Tv2a-2 TaxID=113395 RepID=UPI00040FDEDF|nr:hypothetical protein [Bradyrhizobium sp. Tv2a-2]